MSHTIRRNALDDMMIAADATLLDALRALERGAESIVFVCDDERRVLGTLTDGDVRRAILGGAPLDSRSLRTAMRRDFVSVGSETGRAEVLDTIRARQVEQVPVLDAEGRLCGLHTIARLLSVAERPNVAVLLAGGRGTRLAPLTNLIPKPMVTVAGRPILERLLLHLMSLGIRRFYFSVNYLSHVIEEHFGDGSRFGCLIQYLHETEPLGTGGPLSLLSPVPDEPILVMNGDLVTQCDVGSMIDFHQEGGFVATMGLRHFAVEVPFGAATVQGDRLVALQEKPIERKLINTGIYVLSADAVRMVPKNCPFPITSLFDACLEKHAPVGAYTIDEEWLDVGRPEELIRARGLT